MLLELHFELHSFPATLRLHIFVVHDFIQKEHFFLFRKTVSP